MSSGANALSILERIAGDVQLAALIGNNVVPIIIGTVKEVKVLLQGETIEYTVALSTGADKLSNASDNFQRAIDLINAALEVDGKPPLAALPTTPVTTPAEVKGNGK